MEDTETLLDELSVGLDNVTFAWNFTCPNITTNYSGCNVTFGDDDDEYSYDYDTSSAVTLLRKLVYLLHSVLDVDVIFSSFSSFSLYFSLSLIHI